MVGRWGMSPAIGPIAVLASEGNGMLLPGVSETSESTQRLVDEEVRRIVDSAHHEVTRLLHDYRANLDSLVAELLERETLDEADAYEAAGLTEKRPERTVQLPASRNGGGIDKDGNRPRTFRDASGSPDGNGLPAGLELPELPT